MPCRLVNRLMPEVTTRLLPCHTRHFRTLYCVAVSLLRPFVAPERLERYSRVILNRVTV